MNSCYKIDKDTEKKIIKEALKKLQEEFDKNGLKVKEIPDDSTNDGVKASLKDWEQLDDFIEGKFGFFYPNWDKIKECDDMPEWFEEKYKDCLKDE
jgi:hypothetical protein